MIFSDATRYIDDFVHIQYGGLDELIQNMSILKLEDIVHYKY